MRNFSLLFFLLLFCFSAFSQTVPISISGTILDDATKAPLVGANIIHSQNGNGTISDKNGDFEIKVNAEDVMLTFSYVGYQKEEKPANYFLKNDTITLRLLEQLPIVVATSSLPIYANGPPNILAKFLRVPFSLSAESSNMMSFFQGSPGIQAQQGSLNTNRLIVRGLGTRTPFSTDQVKVYFGDIPLTNGIGDSAIEELESDAVSSMNMISGIGNHSSGSELGGTLIIAPNYYYGNKDSTRVAISGAFSSGSFGRNRQSLGLHLLDKSRSLTNQLFISRTHSDGYRANNNYERRSAYLLGRYRKSNRQTSLNYLFHYRSLEAGIPSSLNINDFNEKPRAAAFNWASVSGNEDANAYFGGLTIRKNKYPGSIGFKATIFAGGNDNFEIRPFNILEEDSQFYGLRANIDKVLPTRKHHRVQIISVGGEWRGEVYDQNLYETLDGGLVGNLFNELKENRKEWFSYLKYNYSSANNNLFIEGGITVRQRQFDWSGTQLSIDQPFVIPARLLPTLRINYRLNQNPVQFVKLIVGKGLSLATGEESLTAATFGNTLNPETGWNTEVQYSLQSYHLYLEFSLFRMTVKDALVNRQTIDGQNYLENAGSAIHHGIEVFVGSRIWAGRSNQKITAEASYTFGDYRFDAFEENGNDYSGNLLPGVPQHTLRLKGILEWDRINLQVTHLFNSEMSVNDGNTEFADGYSVLNFRATYFFPLGEATFDDQRRRIEIFAAVNNIFDTHYTTMVQVNARGFGGNLPRYYYPGLPRYYSVGIALPLQ